VSPSTPISSEHTRFARKNCKNRVGKCGARLGKVRLAFTGHSLSRAGIVRTGAKGNSLGLANPKVSQRTCKTREPNRKAAWNVSVSFWRFLQSHRCRVDARARPLTRKTRPLTHGARRGGGGSVSPYFHSLAGVKSVLVDAAREKERENHGEPCLIFAFRHEFLCL
jgi:hypothetical protein